MKLRFLFTAALAATLSTVVVAQDKKTTTEKMKNSATETPQSCGKPVVMDYLRSCFTIATNSKEWKSGASCESIGGEKAFDGLIGTRIERRRKSISVSASFVQGGVVSYNGTNFSSKGIPKTTTPRLRPANGCDSDWFGWHTYCCSRSYCCDWYGGGAPSCK